MPFVEVIGLSGPDTVMVTAPPNCVGATVPEIESASVAKESGEEPVAGDVAWLPAPSVELTRRKYVVFGTSWSELKPKVHDVPSEVAELMYKPVTVSDWQVALKADMSDPDISEWQLPPHFTNIQHALRLGRQFLAVQDTPNRQIVLITDGLPTAHFEGEMLYLLYPPTDQTEEATLREALLCSREGITINMFLLASWNQTPEDVRFAYKMVESTKGRVFFTAGRELDRYVVWDYIKRRKQIIS